MNRKTEGQIECQHSTKKKSDDPHLSLNGMLGPPMGRGCVGSIPGEVAQDHQCLLVHLEHGKRYS